MRNRAFNPEMTGGGGLFGDFQDAALTQMLNAGEGMLAMWDEWMQDPVTNIKESFTDWPEFNPSEFEFTEDDLMSAMDSFGPGTGLLGGVIKDMRAPYWNKGIKSYPMGVDPTLREMNELLREQDTLRYLKDNNTGVEYMWPADAAMHRDVGDYLGLTPGVDYEGYQIISP